MRDLLALDRASVRRVDQDGHLHISRSIISRAEVSGYLGAEIPGAAALGLDQRRLYQVLRPADALSASASSFVGKPLLSRHRPQTAADHSHALTVGAIGKVTWEAPHLVAELVVWDGGAIAQIQDGTKRALSSGYGFRPVLDTGIFEGRRYSIRMASITGNHVTLCDEPRVSAAVVGDSASPRNRNTTMSDDDILAPLQQFFAENLNPDLQTTANGLLTDLINALQSDDEPALAQDRASIAAAAVQRAAFRARFPNASSLKLR